MTNTNLRSWSTGILALAAAVGMLTAAPTEAAATLTFDQVDNFGTVSYDGAGGALVGSGINFESILGTGTTLNDGVLIDCFGCRLDFTSGPNIQEAGGDYKWAGGGTFTITGGSVAAGIVPGTVLVSGQFSEVQATLAGSLLLVTGFGQDIKDQALLDFYLGVDNPINFTFVDSSINVGGVTVGPGTAFSATLGTQGGINLGNADFVNTVPGPGSVSLLLLGLSGLAAFRRRAS